MRSTVHCCHTISLFLCPCCHSAWPIHSGNRIGDRLLSGQVLYGTREDYISASFDKLKLLFPFCLKNISLFALPFLLYNRVCNFNQGTQ